MQSSITLSNWEVVSNPAFPVTLAHQDHGRSDFIIGTPSSKPVGVYTADCLPLVLTTDTKAFAIHISRHTLTAGILEELTKSIDNEKIRDAYIGPHICENCFVFEEQGEGIQQFEKIFSYAVHKDTLGTHISLISVIENYLRKQDFDISAIIQDNRCTLETPILPSYRRWRAEGENGDFPRIITAVFTKT
ncbi:MAG: hypothetical protein A3C02_04620 [Candidatus Andersenbacteria bacterium RIFCSPHIGHO2_02_FULL_45_11]|uniref:Laccase n=1 Tax=Candidatus Andersenbacteria bacterium RIFCSPHIGHO2_12_FULL_45_11 TaxID=1797281 RepID=A0A1G1X2F4_9BACT|nr:MAG: hypothetical protein A2805_00185 [Candidatus Andersenbacteria bacterium RIFCSPHIGHO2_01_FULL_46_36]OGY32252.1 MAG: hypothetical protein A3C02_04620 [Candidatus Andersenbacteria bacterium RIFCSPHIGHO2_02_FULL_45_11]OGY34188.1 MAG: hypothetical protein A3D99_00520 [Candidatus Andersenbacteria bacterium RIFCSPHIGHO2_12_FULL_45_11]